MGAPSNPRIYGYLVLIAMSVGLLGGNIFYWRAGKAYEKIMKKKDAEAEALEQTGGNQTLATA